MRYSLKLRLLSVVHLISAVSRFALAVGVGEVGGHGFIMLQSTLLSRTEEIHYFEELVDFFLPFFI